MILKSKTKKKLKKNSINKLNKYYFYSTIITLVIVFSIFLNSEMWKYYKLKIFPRLEGYGVLNYLKLPEILILKLKGNFIKTEKLYIDINSKNISKIKKERKQIIKETNENNAATNISFKFNEYNAKIYFKEKSYNINIRLKGDRNIHWNDEKKSSYRIKINNNGKILELSEFSLQKPRARNYIYEWIFHKLHAKNNSINLKYKFIKLYINGENLGLYVIEEFFSKALLERHNRRNGPIFSVIEDYETNFENKKFKTYDKNIWLNKSNIELTKKALNKLKSFLKSETKPSEIFNIDQLAQYVATIELLGTYHGLLLKSQKFYYDPESTKFEIIPFDGHYWNPIISASTQEERDRLIVEISEEDQHLIGELDFGIFLGRQIHKDKLFAKKYFEALNTISSIKFLDNFFNENKENINKINSLIYSDYFLNDFLHFYGPGIYYFDIDEIYKRAKMIRKKLNTNKFKIFAYYENKNIKIENSNIYNPYVYIDSILCGKENDGWELDKVIKFENPLSLRKINSILNEKLYNAECNKLNVFNDLNNQKLIISIDKINGENS